MSNSKLSVQTILKIKPEQNSSAKLSSLVQVLDSSSISLDNKLYKFDYIITDPDPKVFFKDACKPFCTLCLSGTPVTVISYGHSGSGKTFTMYGDSKETGAVQKCCGFLMKKMSNALIKCSFIEIYQEQIYDLLSSTVKALNSKEDSSGVFSIEGLHEELITSETQLNDLIKTAGKKIGGGKSHTVFSLTIYKETPVKIQFVDLAGSERLKKNLANGQIKENAGINKSLSAFNCVVKSLSQNHTYINFRNSKLTQLLKESFLRSKIVMISAISPLKQHFWEDLSTLKLMQRVKKINNHEVQEESTETVEVLQQEINKMTQDIKALQKIETEFNVLSEIHKDCEKKERKLLEKICFLENENTRIHRELSEFNKINNSDWLLSSDSDDEKVSHINKEKKLIEIQCDELKSVVKNSQEKISELELRVAEKTKEIEIGKNLNKDLSEEIEDLMKKCTAYQELSVLLSKQNAGLIEEIGKTKENCYEHPADYSNVSSTDSSKCDFYKIIDEKDAKLNFLLESNKKTEENLRELKEKYIQDTNYLKKQLAKTKTELNKAKSENIKSNSEAMMILNDLKQEKIKLLDIVSSFNESSQKKKIHELKEINSVLLENLKIKGQQIFELQQKFETLLNDKGCSTDLSEKLERKSYKLKKLREEILKIRSFLNTYPQFRSKTSSLSISDCVVDLFSTLCIPYPRSKKPSEIY